MKQFNNATIIAILPAYNASKSLVQFLKTFPKEAFDEVILVDDCSKDHTYDLAKMQKDISVYKTMRNLGYGGCLKMCLGIALAHGADIIVELHPDGEYLVDGIRPALKKVQQNSTFVLGDRFFDRNPLDSGMPLWKYPFLRLLTTIDNLILGTNVGDMHQGFRVYTREFLERINFRSNSNGYIFSFEIIAQAAFKKIPISSVAVTTSYKGKKKGASVSASILYSVQTFRILLLFLCARIGLKTKIFATVGKSSPCPNCNIPYLVEYVLSDHGFDLFFCTMCQNGFTDPCLIDANKYYSREYWNYPGFAGSIRRILFNLFQLRRKRWIEKYVPAGSTILDIGSGEGRFGKTLNGKYSVINIETPFAKIINKDVLKTDFLAWKSQKRFDAVCFWESLEHVRFPQKYLEKASSLLKKGGYIFIEYPRYNSLESRIFSRHWFHLDIPRHLAHLTDGGIVALLERAGLNVIASNSILALEYAPIGFFLSLTSFFAMKRERILVQSAHPMFLLVLSPLLLIGLFAEFLLFIFGQSPIGLTIARKKVR